MNHDSTTTETTALLQRSKASVLGNYGRLPIAVQRAKGCEFWDSDGKRYIDFFAGFGACGLLGHSHPLIVKALAEQSQQLIAHGNFFHSEPQIALAEELLKESFPGRVFFCHSGAEADETALKLVRKASEGKRFKIISFENCFHGRTIGGLSLCPPSFQKGFGPMLPGNLMLPFNDLAAVEEAMRSDPEIGGIFVEAIQGEGGITLAVADFLSGLRELCDTHNALLVIDEVWSGPARTGKFFAYQHYGITPDAVTCAKALGGGLPLACCIIAERFADVLGPGTHGCTTGGNPLAARCGLTAVRAVNDLGLLSNSIKIEELIREYFASDGLDHYEVRGKGAMLGIQLPESQPVSEIYTLCLESGVFFAPAKRNVLRLAPPLLIEEELLYEGLDTLKQVLGR